MLQLLRDRGETAAIPPEDQRRTAEKIKEDYTYVCQDIVKEFKKYDHDPYRYFSRYSGEHTVTGRVSGEVLRRLRGSRSQPVIAPPADTAEIRH